MILEIRTYRLKPGTRAEFVRVMREESVPLVKKYGIDVIDCGASLVDEDGHEEAYLIRTFSSLEAHREQEEAFYSSREWQQGPREAIVSRIESYHTIVVEASPEAVQALRR
ncbi:NIPSNAP family protein [Nonomuraea basaltis]|uniref:NIPSNAP family protein n=1 Tax=Nonomuraea basaltis TaxID=2495887 RepID=UPI00110C4CC6|nr:NIPSNAP family protein [Nonomuraea basaltis]TMR89102.1 NIPSNAP family protein [Nonomuraea basaltis]